MFTAARFARSGQTRGGSRPPGGAAVPVLGLEARLLHPGLLQRLGDKLRRLQQTSGEKRGPVRDLRRPLGRAQAETGEQGRGFVGRLQDKLVMSLCI